MHTIKPDDVDMVIYHGGCPDGFSAAWAAHRRLGDRAQYVGAAHHELPPDVSGRVVAFVDFCYPRAVMEYVQESADGVIVLDHHESAVKAMVGFKGADLRFDMEHSGCVLSWRYFNPGKPVPYMLEAIEARDLWRSDWQQHIEYLSCLDSHGYKSFSKLTWASDAYQRDVFEREGGPIERYRGIMIGGHVDRAVHAVIAGQSLMLVNCTSKELISDVGHRLCRNTGVGACWWYDHLTGKAVVCLRSDGSVNVGAMAQKMGGGGHPGAAGFRMDLTDLLRPAS